MKLTYSRNRVDLTDKRKSPLRLYFSMKDHYVFTAAETIEGSSHVCYF